jgi:hypothetical protein
MSSENSYEGEGCEVDWRTRVTDWLREMLLPTVTISIVSTVWVLGYLRAKESEVNDQFSTPIRVPQMAEEEPDNTSPAAAPTTSPVMQKLTAAAAAPE